MDGWMDGVDVYILSRGVVGCMTTSASLFNRFEVYCLRLSVFLSLFLFSSFFIS